MKRHNVEIDASVLPGRAAHLATSGRPWTSWRGRSPLHVHHDPLPADAKDAVITFIEEPLA
jgi:hypothetical protein